MVRRLFLALGLFVLTIASASCALTEPPTPTSTFTATELRYRVLDAFPDFFWCDPDFFPIGRPGGELENALAQFDGIRNNDEEFAAILQRIGLDQKLNYTTEEQLLVYRQHKLLTRVISDFIPSEDGFSFVILVREGQGERITGNVATDGRIRIITRDPSFNTCPICLAIGTMIDTPLGLVRVENLDIGMSIWTLNENGEKVATNILKTGMTQVASSFELVRVTLEDGRIVTASPRHPTADGRLLGTLKTGDPLDGSFVAAIETVAYEGRTYDILPAGATGLYWANGILLASTLTEPDCGC